MFEKLQKGEKSMMHQDSLESLNLQPSDLCLNAYRNLPGNQDIFSLHIYIYIYIYIYISTPKQPNCKKRCGPCKKKQHEQSCEIKGGGPEVAVVV